MDDTAGSRKTPRGPIRVVITDAEDLKEYLEAPYHHPEDRVTFADGALRPAGGLVWSHGKDRWVAGPTIRGGGVALAAAIEAAIRWARENPRTLPEDIAMETLGTVEVERPGEAPEPSPPSPGRYRKMPWPEGALTNSALGPRLYRW